MSCKITGLLASTALLLLLACGGPQPPVDREGPRAETEDTLAAPTADSLRDGHQRVRDTHGRLLMEGDVRNGRREGVWTAYHRNGAVQSRNEYRDGLLQGLTVVFRENGALYYEGQHADGHPVGTWTFHDEIGTVVRTVEYDSAGVQVGKP